MSAPHPLTPPIAAHNPPYTGPAAASTLDHKPRLSGLALGSVIIGAAEILSLLILRIVAALVSQSKDGVPVLAVTFGILVLVSLLPTVAAIVLGHVAVAQTVRGRRRGVGLAFLGTGIGYVNLLFWGNRVLVAIIAAMYAGGAAQFVPNNFWWA